MICSVMSRSFIRKGDVRTMTKSCIPSSFALSTDTLPSSAPGIMSELIQLIERFPATIPVAKCIHDLKPEGFLEPFGSFHHRLPNFALGMLNVEMPPDLVSLTGRHRSRLVELGACRRPMPIEVRRQSFEVLRGRSSEGIGVTADGSSLAPSTR